MLQKLIQWTGAEVNGIRYTLNGICLSIGKQTAETRLISLHIKGEKECHTYLSAQPSLSPSCTTLT